MNLSECATVSHLFSWLNGKVNVIPIFTMVYKITQPINYPDSRVIKVKEQLPGFLIKNGPISDFSHRKWELNSHPFYEKAKKKAISCTLQIKFSRQQESIAWLLYHGG